MPNIAIVWDFDGTLTSKDSTTMVVESLDGNSGTEFWRFVKNLRGDDDVEDWEHILAADAPIWMYALSRIAFVRNKPLNEEYFKELIANIGLYPNVAEFLSEIKKISELEQFKRTNTVIYHFIVSAGLCDLVRLVFDTDVVRHVWGCRYTVIREKEDDHPESIPVYCIDETMKTRALFEISKGTFEKPSCRHVNKYVKESELFCSFKDMIYIGDGFSDVPALSLIRSKGGMGILVYDPEMNRAKRNEKLGSLKTDRRADLVTKADFALSGELYLAIKSRCIQIQQKHSAYMAF